MSIPMNYQCYLCHFNKHVDTARRYGTEAQVTAFARDLMELYLSAPKNTSLTWFGTGTNALYQKYFTLPEDRFLEEKELSNRFVIQRLDAIRSRVEQADDPVFAGLQYAILGNYIDFSALYGQVSFEMLDELLDKADTFAPQGDAYAQFCDALSKANTSRITQVRSALTGSLPSSLPKSTPSLPLPSVSKAVPPPMTPCAPMRKPWVCRFLSSTAAWPFPAWS